LAELKQKSFPGDSINTSGRISCHAIFPGNLRNLRVARHGASFRAAWFRMAQVLANLGNSLQAPQVASVDRAKSAPRMFVVADGVT